MEKEMKYKITLYGNQLYKEIKLSEEMKNGVRIGTTKECQIRFYRERFFTDFVIKFCVQNGHWVVTCNDSVYLKKKNAFKEYVQYLEPEDNIVVCYAQSDSELFSMEFAVDFENQTLDYNCMIQCPVNTTFTIGGGQSCQIQIRDERLADDFITIIQNENRLVLNANHVQYGVTVNGFRCKDDPVIIEEGNFFAIKGYSFYYSKGSLYVSEKCPMHTKFTIRNIYETSNHLQYPKYVRSARQQYVIPHEKLSVLPPKAKAEGTKRNLLLTMIPTMVSMLMMVMLRMAMGGNKLFIVMCVCMGTMGVVMSVVNYLYDKRQNRLKEEKRKTDYQTYIDEQESKIQKNREKEKSILLKKYPSLEEQLQFVNEFNARLFEKLESHEDFLWLRIGSGTVEANSQVEYKAQEYREVDDPLMDYPQEISEKYQYLHNMPVILQLTDTGSIGVVGSRERLYQMTKNLILTISIEHYYQDVNLFMIMNEEDVNDFSWARWIRNFNNPINGMRNFVYDEDSSKIGLEYLYAELSRREKEKKGTILPIVIVFVYRSELVKEHPIGNYIENAVDLGFRFIFLEEYPEQLNQFCKKRIFLDENNYEAYIQDIDDGEAIQEFRYSHVEKKVAVDAAKKLSCIYIDEVSLESSLTSKISLYQLLKINNEYDLELGKRWANSKVYDSMAAPIGIKSSDEVIYLDLHEKFHGPHGLVAGTTGSGKSEFLQSYIISMATLFHPYEVGFILIDFKGGGMLNQFRNLPHLNGAITNIDDSEINRSLSAIKAELQKRQRLLAEQDVNHIDDYIKKFKSGKAVIPLPHLILIVDEFAELKSEQPEFMKELISAARIGRSLGVHLILATQKPSGVVNDQIWSNSRFRLCLKVQNKADSNEVLKSPLAAEIKEPGRAYLQVGNNEIFDLFQSAYSGAAIPNETLGEQKKFTIAQVELSGRRRIIYEQKPTANNSEITQLDAVVEYIKQYCEKHHIKRLPNICLPSLEETIPYGMYDYSNEMRDVCVPIGLYDNPDKQLQAVIDIDFSQGNVFVIGSSQYGKTNLLQVMIRGLAERYSSVDVNIYILDFASGILKNFEKLKHVGGVVLQDEEEKLQKFYAMMKEEIDRRKVLLAEMGLSSYSSYRETEGCSIPQIVVMIDNAAMLRECYAKYEESFARLIREGAALGISVIVTVQQSSGFGFRYMASFGKRIALYCHEVAEYSAVLGSSRLKLKSVPGRFLLDIEKNIYEGQIYLAFPAEKEIEKVNEIRNFIANVNQTDKGSGARPIPMIPNEITAQMIEELLDEEGKLPYRVPIGMNYASLEVDNINMSKFPMLGVYGADSSAKLNYLDYLLKRLWNKREKEPVELYIIDDENAYFSRYRENGSIYYATDVNSFEPALLQITESLKRRKEKVERGQKIDTEPLLLLLLHNNKSYYATEDNMKIINLCVSMLSEYRNLKTCIILSELPNKELFQEGMTLTNLVAGERNLLIFEELGKQRLLNISGNEKKKYTGEMQYNDAFFMCGNYLGKYKLPT